MLYYTLHAQPTASNIRIVYSDPAAVQYANRGNSRGFEHIPAITRHFNFQQAIIVAKYRPAEDIPDAGVAAA
jgi:hypothetical protein